MDRNTVGFRNPEPVFHDWPSDFVRANFIQLVQRCDPKGLLDCFFQRHLLTEEETECLRKQFAHPNTSTRDINRELLLTVFPKKGAGAFDNFAYCLYFGNENSCRDLFTSLDSARSADQGRMAMLLQRLREVDDAAMPQEETEAPLPATSRPVACSDGPDNGPHTPLTNS
eukprot:scpid22927/ scgid12891/ 